MFSGEILQRCRFFFELTVLDLGYLFGVLGYCLEYWVICLEYRVICLECWVNRHGECDWWFSAVSAMESTIIGTLCWPFLTTWA